MTQFIVWLWLGRWLIGITPVGYPLFAVYHALMAILLVGLLRRITRRNPSLPTALVGAVVWTGMECLRGELIFDGFPWFLLGHPLIGWLAMVQSVDLLGTYFLSTLAAASGGALADVVVHRRSDGRRVNRVAVVVVLLLIANVAYGLLVVRSVHRDPLRILVVQTNLEQDNKNKWTLEQKVADFAGFMDLMVAGYNEATADGSTVDLIVWPETMVPVHGLDLQSLQKLVEWQQHDELRFAEALIDQQAVWRVPILAGVPSYLGLDVEMVDEKPRWIWDEHYNSAYLIDGMLPYQRYDKSFLTPFGEVMPYISAWPWLERQVMAVGARGMKFNLDAADEITTLTLDPDGRAIPIATPICFEATMSRVCRTMATDPDRGRPAALFVNLTNDGWFLNTDSGRALHAMIARFRCIENRVPMVRAANTGYSIGIDSGGKVIGRIGAGRYGKARQPGTLVVELSPDERRTVYATVGDSWAWLTLLLTGLSWISATMFQRKEARP